MNCAISKISRNSSFLSDGEGTLEYIVSYAISKISRNSSFLSGGGRAEQNVSDLANFQEFFISQGWGRSRAQCEGLSKFPGILHFWGVGGEHSRM